MMIAVADTISQFIQRFTCGPLQKTNKDIDQNIQAMHF